MPNAKPFVCSLVGGGWAVFSPWRTMPGFSDYRGQIAPRRETFQDALNDALKLAKHTNEDLLNGR